MLSKNVKMMRSLLFICLSLALSVSACSGLEEQLVPVENGSLFPAQFIEAGQDTISTTESGIGDDIIMP